MHPGSRFAPEPTRAECDAWDEAAAQAEAADVGYACFRLAEDLCAALDKRGNEWSANDIRRLRALHAAMAGAAKLAKEIKP